MRPRKPIPKNDELRPIGARALKSARDTLRPYLSGASVLDLYAGQGRFGIAALEEEAARAVFVESHSRTAADLRRELARWAERAEVVTADVIAFLAGGEARYDIVFADPPFPDWQADFGEQLFRGALSHLVPSGIFLVKHPSRVLLSGWSRQLAPWKSSRFGKSTLAYFRYAPEESTA